MKAKISPRITLENRTKLEEVIPLSTPFVIQIEPTNICNLKCRFCPVGKRSDIKQGMLKMNTFKRIIDNLSEFDKKIKVIHLYGNGEPLLNGNFHEMVKYAKDSGHVNFIDTTTNALTLTSKKIDLIIKSGIDKINVSVNGLTSEQYFDVTQTKINFDKFMNSLQHLYKNRNDCKILIKSISELYNEKDKERFFAMFSPIADYINLENLTNPWIHYDAEKNMNINVRKTAFSNKIEHKYVCCPIFYTLVINFDGSVSLCCVDWEKNLLIGDINMNSVKEIWDSDILFNYQLQHLKGKRNDNKICCECNQVTQCTFDNIDPYRIELLNKLIHNRRKS